MLSNSAREMGPLKVNPPGMKDIYSPKHALASPRTAFQQLPSQLRIEVGNEPANATTTKGVPVVDPPNYAKSPISRTRSPMMIVEPTVPPSGKGTTPQRQQQHQVG
jgi:hypothetical protein